jgi:hypothetical protein
MTTAAKRHAVVAFFLEKKRRSKSVDVVPILPVHHGKRRRRLRVDVVGVST